MKELLIFICCAVPLFCGHNNRTKDTSLTESVVVTEGTNPASTYTIVS